MNPLRSLAQHPISYRVSLKSGALVELMERILRTLTDGRVGVMDLAGLPSLRLTVPGRKTGIARTTTLTYIRDGGRYLVVGSNWGRAAHPGWTANLLASRHVAIACRGNQFTAAPLLLLGAERDRAWHTVLAGWPNYRIAQEMAGSREFRIFELLPSPNQPAPKPTPGGGQVNVATRRAPDRRGGDRRRH